jgi:large subunit ribosomal protein L3
MRTGLVAKKIGMSRYYTDQGKHLPVTILKMDPTQVVEHKTKEKNGYTAIVIGTGERKLKNISKPIRGQFNKAKLEPKAKLIEFRVADDALVDIGANLSVSHFVAGQKVDVTSFSKGKGFQGGMKRWNFGGLEASHGISISHRSIGSTGQCQDPGRVFKGKKMAGQMGNTQITVQNLEIIETDTEENLIIIKGAIPGGNGSLITIRDAVKHDRPEAAPYPAGRKRLEAEVAAAEEEAVAAAKAEEEAAANAAAEELAKAEAKAREESKEADSAEDTATDAPVEETKEEESKDES